MADWNGFISSLKSGGRARACMFEWIVPPPELGSVIGNADYKLRSASMPGSSVETLTAYWFGLEYKIGGSRRFNDWTVSIMCDNQSLISNIRVQFEAWINSINLIHPFLVNKHGATKPKSGNLINASYLSRQSLAMLDDEGNKTTIIVLEDSWPKEIGDITLDHTSTDFATFDVTFSYLYSYVLDLSLNL